MHFRFQKKQPFLYVVTSIEIAAFAQQTPDVASRLGDADLCRRYSPTYWEQLAKTVAAAVSAEPADIFAVSADTDFVVAVDWDGDAVDLFVDTLDWVIVDFSAAGLVEALHAVSTVLLYHFQHDSSGSSH